jgi:hypothetical protein
MITSESLGPEWGVFEAAAPGGPAARDDVLTKLGGLLARAVQAEGAAAAEAVFWTERAVADTPSSRRRGFWMANHKLKAALPPEAVRTEQALPGPEGLRFLASVQSAPNHLPTLLKLVLAFQRNRAVVLVRLEERASIGTAPLVGALSGNEFELGLARDLGTLASRENVVVAVPTGRFDDPETGVFLCAPSLWAGAHPGLGLRPE